MRCSEPGTDAYRALDNLKEDVTKLIAQRDSQIKRYEEILAQLVEIRAERDYYHRLFLEAANEVE